MRRSVSRDTSRDAATSPRLEAKICSNADRIYSPLFAIRQSDGLMRQTCHAHGDTTKTRIPIFEKEIPTTNAMVKQMHRFGATPDPIFDRQISIIDRV